MKLRKRHPFFVRFVRSLAVMVLQWNPNLKEKVAKGAVWTLCEKQSCQAVGFVVGRLGMLEYRVDMGFVSLCFAVHVFLVS